MSIPKIKTNLFSFKTFRSPDKIDINEKDEFFIQHPNITQSQFNQCPIRNATGTNEQDYLNFIGNFTPASGYKEIRNLNTAFYDYSSLLMQQKKNDSSKKPLTVQPPAPLANTAYMQIWVELFVQITTQQSKSARQACLQMIIAQFYILNAQSLNLNDIAKLVIVIPEIVTKCFKPWQFANCGGKLFGVHNLGIQEYRRVEQTLCCYVPGEVSHIENVMAREFKEKSTRNLLRTEQSTEFTSETTIENINDTTTTERNELSSEVAKLLQKDKSFDLSGSVTVSKDSKAFGKITANVSTGYNSSSSSALSNTEAKNYSKELTERALERIVQKTTEKRTYSIIKEFEENNKHGFDNRLGTKHVTGVYRWVDKIYDNELVNYGKRLVLEVEVPNPALLYKKAMEWKSKKNQDQQSLLTPPKNLGEFGINGWSDIANENISSLATEYGISIDSYQTQVQFVDVSYGAVTDRNNNTKTDIQSPIMIPLDFVADRIDGIGSFEHRGNSNTKAYLKLNFGGQEIYRGDYNTAANQTDTFNISLNVTPKALGSLSFAVTYRQVLQYSGSFKVKCVSDPALFKDWQETVYGELQAAYQNKLDEYNEELRIQQAAQEAARDQEGSENFSNPAFNRLIEERELKRNCIEMLSKPYCYDMGKKFYDCTTYNCTSCEDEEIEAIIPENIQNLELEKYAEFIKFFETAFQWEIFSYILYPYYYNEKCSWYELLQTKNADPIFEAFLQSGMAKILVPVRPQFEKAVLWYLETGEIYTEGDIIPETEDDRYLSLLNELINQDEITVEGEWKTRVPSMLTIIQAKSTYLEDEQGLPCCDEETDNFGSNDELLSGLDNIDEIIIEE